MPDVYDNGLDPDNPSITAINSGLIIAYRLLPRDMPVNPLKVWRGKVIYCTENAIMVESMEPGFNGLQEIISYEQVIGIS